MSELIEHKRPEIENLFKKGGIQILLDHVKSKVSDFKPDLSSKKGRSEIGSIAYKVSTSKTLIDSVGKELVDPIKAQANVIDAERRKAKSYLDKLRDEVKKPLVDWENKEKERVEAHREAIKEIEHLGKLSWENRTLKSLSEIEDSLKRISLIEINDSWEEFQELAQEKKNNSETLLTARVIQLNKEEDLRLAKEEAEKKERDRIRKERDKKIREDAKRQAEQKAKIEAEKENLKALEREEKVKKEKEIAEERARLAEERARKEKTEHQLRLKKEKEEYEARLKKEKEAAIAQERKMQEELKRKEEDAKLKRQENLENRKRVNKEALAAVNKISSNIKTNELIIEAVARGEVPHVKIFY